MLVLVNKSSEKGGVLYLTLISIFVIFCSKKHFNVPVAEFFSEVCYSLAENYAALVDPQTTFLLEGCYPKTTNIKTNVYTMF